MAKLKHILRRRIPLTGGNGSPAVSHTACGRAVAAFRGRIAPPRLATCPKCIVEHLTRAEPETSNQQST